MRDDQPATVANAVFVRDQPTWLSYGALGAYAFWLYAFGPAIALLRGELGFSYTMVSVYSAAWSAGAVVAGAFFARLTARGGRRAVLWGSTLATTAGAVVFTVPRDVSLTLVGAILMGFAGTTMQMTTQSVLSDHHGTRRDQALVESNIGAGACAVLAPLALGGLGATPTTWRAAMALPVLALTALYLTYRREPLPAVPRLDQRASAGSRSRLSLACGLLGLLVAVGIGVEFCVVYFGAELVTSTARLSTAAAATAMTAFYVGILAGRVAGGRLSRDPARTPAVLWVSLVVTLAGLLALWLSHQAPIALAGLFVSGLGIANLFPLSLALVLASAPGQTDAANARAQLFGGLLVIAAPFALGALADHVGLVSAFSITPLLAVCCGLLLAVASRLRARETTTQRALSASR